MYPRGPPLTDDRGLNRDRNLDDVVAGAGGRLAGQAVTMDADRRRFGAPGDRDADQLQRRIRRATKSSVDSAETTRMTAPYGDQSLR